MVKDTLPCGYFRKKTSWICTLILMKSVTDLLNIQLRICNIQITVCFSNLPMNSRLNFQVIFLYLQSVCPGGLLVNRKLYFLFLSSYDKKMSLGHFYRNIQPVIFNWNIYVRIDIYINNIQNKTGVTLKMKLRETHQI